MKKLLFAILMVLMTATSSFAVYTCTATKAGCWNDTSVWSGCNSTYPHAGDTVALASYVVTMTDAATCTGASATSDTGALAAIGAATTGQIAIDLSNAACNGGCAITATTITPGSVGTTGFIATSGADATHTLTVTGTLAGGASVGIYHNSTATLALVGSVTGGTATNMHGIVNVTTGAVTINNGTGNAVIASNYAYGLYNTAIAAVTITGHIIGGGGVNIRALFNNTTGLITVTGNLIGGSSLGSTALYQNGAAGTAVITGNVIGGSAYCTSPGYLGGNASWTLDGNIIDTDYCQAFYGRPPTITANTTRYLQRGGTSGTKYYYDVPDVGNVRTNDTVGGVTGTYAPATGGAWSF